MCKGVRESLAAQMAQCIFDLYAQGERSMDMSSRYWIAVIGPDREIAGIGTSPEMAIADAVEQVAGAIPADFDVVECTEALYNRIRADGADPRRLSWIYNDQDLADVSEPSRTP
jgi:hypothetical protein